MKNKKLKQNHSSINVDSFMREGLAGCSDDEDEEDEEQEPTKSSAQNKKFPKDSVGLKEKAKKEKKLKKESAAAPTVAKTNGISVKKTKKKAKKSEEVDEDSGSDNELDDEKSASAIDHRNALARLEKADPEFFKFLKDQDADLLDFDESDEEEPEEDEDEEPEEDDDEDADEPTKKKQRQVKTKTDKDGRKVLDANVLDSLETALSEERPSPSAVRRAAMGFTACVARVGAQIDAPTFVIKDEQVFDGLVRLCFSQLGEALYSILEPIKQESHDVTKEVNGDADQVVKGGPQSRFRRWKKHSTVAKQYLSDLLTFLGELQESDVISATIRAITKMMDLYVVFAKLSRQLVKQLVRVWSRKQEQCRVVAFIALSKLIKVQPDMFSFVIKSCYLGFVSNSRLVTADTWPLIMLMQQSFADLCMLDPVVAYQYAFVYIRQTGIHLRNAMIAKKKELVQAVYNWQFVQCLNLWTRVIVTAAKSVEGGDESIRELAYPLVQIIVGCANLLPTVKYYPLRFHCVRALIRLQVGCGIFTPAIPLLTHVLASPEQLGKRNVRHSAKPPQLDCLLKASKAMIEENGFKDAVIDTVCDLLLEAAHVSRSSVAFPELIMPVIVKMKLFTKRCKVGNYSRQVRALIEKLEEHGKFVDSVRSRMSLNLADPASIHEVEYALRTADSPLAKYFASWSKMSALKKGQLAQKVAKSKVKEEPEGNDVKPSIVGKKIKSKAIKDEKPPPLKKMKLEKWSPPPEDAMDTVQDLVLSDSD